MRIKEAMFFNIVSSVLCLIGMLVGIGVSNVTSASSWIFAFTAGTFVYIAMVDMVSASRFIAITAQTRNNGRLSLKRKD